MLFQIHSIKTYYKRCTILINKGIIFSYKYLNMQFYINTSFILLTLFSSILGVNSSTPGIGKTTRYCKRWKRNPFSLTVFQSPEIFPKEQLLTSPLLRGLL
jgi:hypothetical protein